MNFFRPVRSDFPTLRDGVVILFLAITLLLLMPADAAALEVDCSSELVTVMDARIRVAPSGTDDTDNIRCALNEAARLGVQKVKLESGVYVVSSAIGVGGFRGQFEGVTRESTTIVVADGSFACTTASGRAAFAFAVGEPTVRYMRFEVGDPCASGAGGFSVLAFLSNPEDCSKRTLFGTVDRVDFVRDGSSSTPAVTVAAFVDRAPGCPADMPALGTFKLNRSEISGFTYGLFSSMGGGAQVDVNFNSFSGNEMGVYISNANQNTSIAGNDFVYGDLLSLLLPNSAGVEVVSDGGGRDGNHTVVHNNRFHDAGLGTADTDGVLVIALNKRLKQSVIVTNNRFEMSGGSADSGVSVLDADGGTIQNNRFVGSANEGIFLGPFFHTTAAKGWAISGNTFSAFDAIRADIYLLEGTTDTFVGPQAAMVIAPLDNYIAEQ